MENNYDFGEELHNKLKTIDTTDDFGGFLSKMFDGKIKKTVEPISSLKNLNTLIMSLENGFFSRFYAEKVIKYLQKKI
ncbi:MAG: hypothetical protein ACOCVF_04090 [bacterium]